MFLICDGCPISTSGAGRSEKTLSVVCRPIVNLCWFTKSQNQHSPSPLRRLQSNRHGTVFSQTKLESLQERKIIPVYKSQETGEVISLKGTEWEEEAREGRQDTIAPHLQGGTPPPTPPQGGGSHLNRLRPGDRRQKPPQSAASTQNRLFPSLWGRVGVVCDDDDDDYGDMMMMMTMMMMKQKNICSMFSKIFQGPDSGCLPISSMARVTIWF